MGVHNFHKEAERAVNNNQSIIIPTGKTLTFTNQSGTTKFTVDSSGNVTVAGNMAITGALTADNPTFTSTIVASSGIGSSSPSALFGYAIGAGGAVTQATNRTTGVELNTKCGAITLISGAGSATPATFTVTNSRVGATDTIILNQKSGTDKYELHVTAVAAGSFDITYFTTGGTTTEQPVFNFAILDAIAS